MKIVERDNFGGDIPFERVLLWPMRKDIAERIADALNDGADEHATRYDKVVENDYVLQPRFEP